MEQTIFLEEDKSKNWVLCQKLGELCTMLLRCISGKVSDKSLRGQSECFDAGWSDVCLARKVVSFASKAAFSSLSSLLGL